MPADVHNPYPHPTAEQVADAPGGREIKAARNVMARHVTGIPRRPYLLGESDHAPVTRGVADLTQAVFTLLDAIEHRNKDGMNIAVAELKALMSDHGCPSEDIL